MYSTVSVVKLVAGEAPVAIYNVHTFSLSLRMHLQCICSVQDMVVCIVVVVLTVD